MLKKHDRVHLRLASVLATLGVAVVLPMAHAPELSRAEEKTPTPTAVLMACHGVVTVQRADGSPVEGRFGLSLHPGDRVRTGRNGHAEIALEDGTWLEVGPGSGMGIKTRSEAKPPTPTAPTDGFEVVQKFIRLRDSEGGSVITGLRGGGAALRAISPVQTRVRPDAIRFAWKTAHPGDELQLTLYDENGIAWSKSVTGTTSVDYPASAPALRAGVGYSWTVETTDPLVIPPRRSKAAYFEVLPGKEADTLREALATIDSNRPNGRSTYHVMRASVFFDHGLLSDAIDETNRALAGDPNNADLHVILARLYAKSGRSEDALREFKNSP